MIPSRFSMPAALPQQLCSVAGSAGSVLAVLLRGRPRRCPHGIHCWLVWRPMAVSIDAIRFARASGSLSKMTFSPCPHRAFTLELYRRPHAMFARSDFSQVSRSTPTRSTPSFIWRRRVTLRLLILMVSRLGRLRRAPGHAAFDVSPFCARPAEL